MEKRPPGRPQGRVYVRTKTVKLRQSDVDRLEALAKDYDRDQSWVIRHAIERLMEERGLE
jgi:predicted transcriptional regulator